MRAVQFFAAWKEIDLYGQGWDGPSFQMGWAGLPGSVQKIRRKLLKQWQKLRPVPLLEAARSVYRGVSSSKLDTISEYTYLLCFENVILKGWVTEKIFDCFAAVVSPMFCGGPDMKTTVSPRPYVSPCDITYIVR